MSRHPPRNQDGRRFKAAASLWKPPIFLKCACKERVDLSSNSIFVIANLVHLLQGPGNYEALEPLEAADFGGWDGPVPACVPTMAVSISVRSSFVSCNVAA
jgi:hypothetical protein